MTLRRRGYLVTEDEEQRRLRSTPFSEDHRLPNVHKIVPPYHMKQVQYRGQKMITVYRGVGSKDANAEIRPGDWVALTRSYAANHGGGRVISKRVPAMDVSWAGTDMNEWFYTPRKG